MFFFGELNAVSYVGTKARANLKMSSPSSFNAVILDGFSRWIKIDCYLARGIMTTKLLVGLITIP